MLSNKNPTHPDEIASNNLRELFLQEYAITPNVYKICLKLGIDRTLVYRDWYQDGEFRRRFLQVRENQVNEIEDNLFEEAQHNKKAIVPQIFILKSWKPERYGDRTESNINVNIDLSSRALDTINKAKQLIQAEDASFQVIEPDKLDQGTE